MTRLLTYLALVHAAVVAAVLTITLLTVLVHLLRTAIALRSLGTEVEKVVSRRRALQATLRELESVAETSAHDLEYGAEALDRVAGAIEPRPQGPVGPRAT